MSIGKTQKKSTKNSGVHVLLVSLFGIPIFRSISNFSGRPKKNWSTKEDFGMPKNFFRIPKRNLVDQKKIWSSKKKYLEYQKKFSQPKK